MMGGDPLDCQLTQSKAWHQPGPPIQHIILARPKYRVGPGRAGSGRAGRGPGLEIITLIQGETQIQTSKNVTIFLLQLAVFLFQHF